MMAVDAQFRLLAEGLAQLVFLATTSARLDWANRRTAATKTRRSSSRRRSSDAGFGAHMVEPIDVDRLAALLAELSHN